MSLTGGVLFVRSTTWIPAPMAYRFKLDEPVGKGFKRIARDQIEQALAALGPAEIAPAGVHESRKALKRLRALIRLAAPAIGAKAARQHNVWLRDAGRLLSQQRDEAVTRETLTKLEAVGGPEVVTALVPLRTVLDAAPPAGSAVLDTATAEHARASLAKEAKRLQKTKFKGRGFAALEKGLEVSYRAGRNALAKAYNEPTDEAFHELRKTVQWHWRQMSLLSRAWPEVFLIRIAAARELSQILGDDHDLAMLEHAAARYGTIEAAALDKIRHHFHERQAGLREAARARAERLFAEPPRLFVRRMAAYWEAGGRIKPWPELQAAPEKAAATGAVAVASAPRLAAKTTGDAPSQRRA